MQNYLEKIIQTVRERNEAMKATLGPNDTSRLVSERPDSPRGFAAAMCQHTDKTMIIGEIKRGSPSMGLLDEELDAAEIAIEYDRGGATALSVVTEQKFYYGNVSDLQAAREVSKLPVLRKDFIIDPYQVPRSYGAGADAILVVVRAVEDDIVLRQIFEAAENIHLDVLTEVYDEADCERILRVAQDAPSALRLVGINSRDLTTFETDLTHNAKLAPYFPDNTTLIALSGIKARADIEFVRANCPRISRFLVGEALLRAEYPGDALASFLDPAPAPAARGEKGNA